MKKSIIILIFITLNSCKPSPTYNAFDKEFNISIREVTKDGCDTISAGCGWFNLQQKKGRLRNYYQIYLDDWNNVVAKGFDYFLDTLIVKGEKDYNKIRSIKISNKNITELNSELEKYGYKFQDQKEGKYENNFVQIINEISKDTVELDIQLNWNDEKDSIIYRRLSYWKEK
tara:strand:- start:45 stop:560 length:516 start_codon:yes stop_codon:yes gene_type:complete